MIKRTIKLKNGMTDASYTELCNTMARIEMRLRMIRMSQAAINPSTKMEKEDE
jgi:hypothetical protein